MDGAYKGVFIYIQMVCVYVTHNTYLFSYMFYFSIIKRPCLKKKVYEEIKVTDKRSILIGNLTLMGISDKN